MDRQWKARVDILSTSLLFLFPSRCSCSFLDAWWFDKGTDGLFAFAFGLGVGVDD